MGVARNRTAIAGTSSVAEYSGSTIAVPRSHSPQVPFSSGKAPFAAPQRAWELWNRFRALFAVSSGRGPCLIPEGGDENSPGPSEAQPWDSNPGTNSRPVGQKRNHRSANRIFLRSPCKKPPRYSAARGAVVELHYSSCRSIWLHRGTSRCASEPGENIQAGRSRLEI